MSSTCSLGFKNSEELAPRGIQNGFRQMTVLDHSGDLKVFHHNASIAISIGLSRLEMVISPLATNLQMRLGHGLRSLAFAVTAPLTAAHLALLASKRSGRRAIEPWVLNRVALTIGQKGPQPYVNANSGMLTGTWQMLRLRLYLTDDQSVPMPISPHHEMHGLGLAFERSVQLDLEEVPQLLRHNQVFLLLMQIAIFAVLPELDGMPAVRLLKARKPNSREMMLFGSEKPFEGLREPISKHLHGGGWYMFALSFESLFQVILAGECLILLILRLDCLKHAIINGARLCQASHEQAGLFLIHEKAKLKRSHVDILM